MILKSKLQQLLANVVFDLTVTFITIKYLKSMLAMHLMQIKCARHSQPYKIEVSIHGDIVKSYAFIYQNMHHTLLHENI